VTANRKSPANFGTIVSEALQPPGSPDRTYTTAPGRYSVVMPERVLISLLRTEVDRLAAPENVRLLRGFFSHFFDPMVGEAERESYVTSFQRSPPSTKLGYARSSSDFPCYAVVLESDKQSDDALADYLGETTPHEPDAVAKEYVGSMFEQTIGIYVFAEHPDVCLYMYQLAKAILIGSLHTLTEYGILDPRYDGSDLNPQETYLPETMFTRRLGVTLKSLMSVPNVLAVDPARVRIGGLFAEDIAVGGVRGALRGRIFNAEDE